MSDSGNSHFPVKISIEPSCQLIGLGIIQVFTLILSVRNVLFRLNNKILALNILAILDKESINQVPIKLNHVADKSGVGFRDKGTMQQLAYL